MTFLAVLAASFTVAAPEKGGSVSERDRLSTRQEQVLGLVRAAGPNGADYWDLREALGRSPSQSIRALVSRGLVEYGATRYFAAVPRPKLTVIEGGTSEGDECNC